MLGQRGGGMASFHDALFKSTFSQVEHAAGELRAVLPAAVSARIDWTTLTLTPGSFVDEALRERQTDLLFSANIGERAAMLYLLFEHQSTAPDLMAFRLLRYMVRIWEGYLRDHKDAKLLPVIVPVVLHHSVTGWTAATALEDLYDADPGFLEALGPHAARLRIVLDDISMESDDSLRARAMSALGRLSLWCLRHAREADELVGGIGPWLSLVREVRRDPGGAAALATLWRYIFSVQKTYDPEELVALLVSAAGEEDMAELLSAADKLHERGRKEGVKEGERQGQQRALLRQLSARFGALSETVTARIQASDVAELDRWTDRVLTAGSLDELFAASS